MNRQRPHAELRPTDFVVAIDTREQMPFPLVVQYEGEEIALRTVTKTLDTGDYSIVGAENLIALERKSLSDLIGCIGSGRERFEREMQRLLSYKAKCVIVEAPRSMLELGQWRGQVTPSQAIGSVIGWEEAGIPFAFCSDRRSAALYCARFLYIAARRRFRELRAFMDSLKLQPANDDLVQLATDLGRAK